MATVLDISALRAQITGTHVRTAENADAEGITGQTSVRNVALEIAFALANGTGNGQADLIFMDTHTLAGGATKQYDLAGVELDPNGNLLTFATVKAIILYSNLAANKVLTLTTPAANGFDSWHLAAQQGVLVNPLGVLLLATPNTGYATAAGTDLLDVVNAGGGNSTFDLIIVGTSA